MVTCTVIEVPRRLEPVTPDSFVDRAGTPTAVYQPGAPAPLSGDPNPPRRSA